jgi:serine/threonine protein kinase
VYADLLFQEIIPYPPVSQVAHLGCRRIRESEVEFHSHMSGFVYKVDVGGEILIKKEIPSPETIEEFLYEINALNSLTYSDNVINFHGVVVDEYDEFVKGLLISYADGGALIDVIYDNCKDPNGQGLAWPVRERWARQIVNGLADIHESGYVQGDFTLSNIVIDHKDDAKIIDINRRGCPVGWEPPEATALLDSNHRISMYIGIKSDLYQLGMVLWALAMEDDEPDLERRPLVLGPEAKVPEWYRVLTESCLHPDPRRRLQASQLAQMFPPEESRAEHISVDDGLSQQSYYVDECNTVRPPSDWSHYDPRFTPSGPPTYDAWNYAPRGRSPPSPLPSNPDVSESHRGVYSPTAWAARRFIRPSYSDAGADDVRPDDAAHHFTPTPTADRIDFPAGELRLDEEEGDVPDDSTSADATPTEPKDKAPVDGQALGESLEVSRNLHQDGSEAGEDAADSEPLKEISHNIQKKEAQEAAADSAKASADPIPDELPSDHGGEAQAKDDVLAEPPESSKAEEAIASEETKAPEADISKAPDVEAEPASDEPTPTAAVDENKSADASLESAEADAPEALAAKAVDIDEAVGAAAATEAGSPESEAEKDIDPTPKAAEVATDTTATPDPPAETPADKEADKDDKETIANAAEVPTASKDQDDSKIEEAAAPASSEAAVANSEEAHTEAKDAVSPVDDAKEEVSEQKKDEDVEKKEDANTPIQLPEQPDVQAESTLDKDALQSESGPSATKGPDANPDEPAEQAPGQQAVPASDDLPPGKLDASELVNGDDIQEPRSSDPPDDSSRPDDESGVKAEPTVPEMPEMVETGDQVVAAATLAVSANEDTAPKTELEAAEPAAANPEASAPDLPDALAGIGSGLPNIENSAISEQGFIHDDDFHATRRPEPLTT